MMDVRLNKEEAKAIYQFAKEPEAAKARLDEKIDNIYRSIRAAASTGEYSISFDGRDFDSVEMKTLFADLESRGYKIGPSFSGQSIYWL